MWWLGCLPGWGLLGVWDSVVVHCWAKGLLSMLCSAISTSVSAEASVPVAPASCSLSCAEWAQYQENVLSNPRILHCLVDMTRDEAVVMGCNLFASVLYSEILVIRQAQDLCCRLHERRGVEKMGLPLR